MLDLNKDAIALEQLDRESFVVNVEARDAQLQKNQEQVSKNTYNQEGCVDVLMSPTKYI